MPADPREIMNFRLGRSEKEALYRLAREEEKPVGQLVREVVEEYLGDRERAAWTAEAQRAAVLLGGEARRPLSDEAGALRELDAQWEAFSRDWVWEGEEL